MATQDATKEAATEGKTKVKQVRADAEKAADAARDNGPEPTAPGEKEVGGETIKVKATGPFLVYDPFTLDYVGEDGGEMRVTQFVRNMLAEGKLEEK